MSADDQSDTFKHGHVTSTEWLTTDATPVLEITAVIDAPALHADLMRAALEP